MENLLEALRFDERVKSPAITFYVTPAQAGVTYDQSIAGAGLRRHDGLETMNEPVKFGWEVRPGWGNARALVRGLACHAPVNGVFFQSNHKKDAFSAKLPRNSF